MKAFTQAAIAVALALALPAQTVLAQEPPPPQQQAAPERPAFRQEQLDQILAPIALHPDPLLSQILMAATYPLEVVQAARWSRANPNLKGEAAVKAVEQMDWDPSVKSLVAFPEILLMMDERLEWTQDLGEAFLAQQAQVLDTIQGLRRRAEAQGNLQSNERMAVQRQGDYIGIEPPDPGVVNVPYYDPRVAYGPWPEPAYPPAYWGPPVGYYGGWGPGLWWGPSVVVAPGFFFGAFVWPHRHVVVAHHHHHALWARHAHVAARGAAVWRHDAYHRRGVQYRQTTLRQEFRQTRRELIEARRDLTDARATRRAAEGARETRDRRLESAPRQLRQEAPRLRTEAPVVNRNSEARRATDDTAVRRLDAQRRETPRIERNTRTPERVEQRLQPRMQRSNETRGVRERSARERAWTEERARAARIENQRARIEREKARARSLTEERVRGPRVEHPRAAQVERSARGRAVAEERRKEHRAAPSESRQPARAERRDRERG